MPVIRKDKLGLYAFVAGWVARPTKASVFKEGDKPIGKHFGGSPVVGIGKLPGRANYMEYWATSDDSKSYKKAK